MKSVKYLFVAAIAALTLASCDQKIENDLVNPKGSPVQFTLSGANSFTGSKAAVKVTANAPVPANVNITLALDLTASTVKAENMSFPALIINKGETEASGEIGLDPSGLAPGTNFKVVVKATISGVDLAQKLELSYKTDPEPEKPAPGTVTVDGEIEDWDNLEDEFVVFMACDGGAELSGLKSAQVYYSDKLYMLLEVTNEALATGVTDGKLRFHIFFNGDNNKEGGLLHRWSTPDIDYMLEGKMTSGGEYCDFSSNYYKWNGAEPTAWSWEGTDVAPAFKCAGKDNYYELSMDYSTYPGGLADIFTIGFDIADGNYNVIGYLPNVAGDTCPKAKVKKVGYVAPVPAIDGNLDDWAEIESVSNGSHGAFKVASDDTNIYFYSWRTTSGRYSDIWGGSGYLYIAFNLDSDASNDVELNGNGPYDFIGFFSPYGGTSAAPAFLDAPGNTDQIGWAPETPCTLNNIKWAGVINEDGAFLEYSIPRADLPAIPKTQITVTSWGNKDMGKVSIECTL